MQITINDEIRQCSKGTTISGLLETLDIDERYVAVEINRKIIPRTQFSERELQDSDNLEIVTFVGGG